MINIIEKQMFEVGDEVIFVDVVNGTSISDTGRLGKVKTIMGISNNNERERYYGIEWFDKKYSGDDDQWSATIAKCLRKADLNIPELYVLHTLHRILDQYEAFGFTPIELKQLAILKDEGKLEELMK